MTVVRDNARLLPAGNRHFRSFFALVMRGAVDRMLSNFGSEGMAAEGGPWLSGRSVPLGSMQCSAVGSGHVSR